MELALISLISGIGAAGFTQIVFSEVSERENFSRYQLRRSVITGSYLTLLGSALVVPWFWVWNLSASLLLLFLPLVSLMLAPTFNLCASLVRAEYGVKASVFLQISSFFMGYLMAAYLALAFKNELTLFVGQIGSQLLFVLVFFVFYRQSTSLAYSKHGGHSNAHLKAEKSDQAKITFLRNVRFLSAISYVSNNIFRWATAWVFGSMTLGHLNRGEALAVGPIGQVQNAFTSSISAGEQGSKKLHMTGESDTRRIIGNYALAVLSGALFLSIILPEVTFALMGPKWSAAGTISGWILLSWAGTSVFSASSYIFEVQSRWRQAFIMQFSGLFLGTFSVVVGIATRDFSFAVQFLGLANYLGAVTFAIALARKSVAGSSQGSLVRKIFFSSAFLAVLLLLPVSPWVPYLREFLVIIGLGFSAIAFILAVRGDAD